MDLVAPALPLRKEVIHEFKENGGSIAAVLPIHYPRSLFRAFNILPVEVWGPPGVDVTLGAGHLQPYICSIVRNALSFTLSGGLDVADFLVIPHACDSLQGLGSILIDFVKPDQPVLPIYLPRGVRESDTAYLAGELRQLYGQLGALTGMTPSDEELMRCIHREEEADRALASLHENRRVIGLDDLSFYRLIRSREYLPAENFVDSAQAVLDGEYETVSNGIPLILSGIVPEPMAVFEALSAMGGTVVADDLACCGRRLYRAGHSRDPFRRMAERILSAPPDPTRGNPIAERVDHLNRMAERHRAKGIIFYGVKFCEPELFDLPDLRRSLKEAGLPSIALEVDINDPLPYQAHTRLESFLEMLR